MRVISWLKSMWKTLKTHSIQIFQTIITFFSESAPAGSWLATSTIGNAPNYHTILLSTTPHITELLSSPPYYRSLLQEKPLKPKGGVRKNILLIHNVLLGLKDLSHNPKKSAHHRWAQFGQWRDVTFMTYKWTTQILIVNPLASKSNIPIWVHDPKLCGPFLVDNVRKRMEIETNCYACHGT